MPNAGAAGLDLSAGPPPTTVPCVMPAATIISSAWYSLTAKAA